MSICDFQIYTFRSISPQNFRLFHPTAYPISLLEPLKSASQLSMLPASPCSKSPAPTVFLPSVNGSSVPSFAQAANPGVLPDLSFSPWLCHSVSEASWPGHSHAPASTASPPPAGTIVGSRRRPCCREHVRWCPVPASAPFWVVLLRPAA